MIYILDEAGLQLTQEEYIDRYVLNRPLKNLNLNDSLITTAIESNLTTNKITVDNISSVTNNLTINSDVIFKNGITVYASKFYATVDELTVTDSVVEFNKGELGSEVRAGEAGLELFRNSSVSNGYFKWVEDSKFWEISGSGAIVQGLASSTLINPEVKTETIDLDIHASYSSTPSAGDVRLFVDEERDNLLSFNLKKANSSKIRINSHHDIYDNYINTQSRFDGYFGNSDLTGSGTTSMGWNYSKLSNVVHVYQEADYKLILYNGNYKLSTKVHLTPGKLHGQNKTGTVIDINNSSIGFVGEDVDNIEFSGFKLSGDSSIPVTDSSRRFDTLFYLRNVNDSNFDVDVEYAYGSTIFDASSCTNLKFGDMIENNAICFKDIEK